MLLFIALHHRIVLQLLFALSHTTFLSAPLLLPLLLLPLSTCLIQHPQPCSAYVVWLCGSLNDPRIANPDVQESLLQVRVGVLLHHEVLM